MLIHKAGFDAYYLGVVELEVRKEKNAEGTKTVAVTPSWRMISTRGVAADPAIAARVAAYEDTLKDDLSTVMGKTTVALDARRAVVRGGEPNFGDLVADAMRAAVGGGEALIPSNAKGAAVGGAIDLPLGHKDQAWSFAHFDTITVMIGDAPRPDEIVLCMAVADGGRPLPRVGDKPITD